MHKVFEISAALHWERES